MKYAAIKEVDTANGPGSRVSLFVSGCTHACPGCFNAQAWDFSFGTPYDVSAENRILNALDHSYIRGFSCLGGEPMEPANRGTVLRLMSKIKSLYPEKEIWCYTGYLLEDLLIWAGMYDYPALLKKRHDTSKRILATNPRIKNPSAIWKQPIVADHVAPDAFAIQELLSCIDILVDGEYFEEDRNLRIPFRGSENQRIIDVKATLQSKELIIHMD